MKITEEELFDQIFWCEDEISPEEHKSYSIKLLKSFAEQVARERDEEIRKLKFMIDNGLGWEDLKNDINYPDNR